MAPPPTSDGSRCCNKKWGIRQKNCTSSKRVPDLENATCTADSQTELSGCQLTADGNSLQVALEKLTGSICRSVPSKIKLIHSKRLRFRHWNRKTHRIGPPLPILPEELFRTNLACAHKSMLMLFIETRVPDLEGLPRSARRLCRIQGYFCSSVVMPERMLLPDLGTDGGKGRREKSSAETVDIYNFRRGKREKK